MDAIWLAAFLLLTGCGQGEVLRASHQWPDGDVRGAMLEVVQDEIDAADVGLVMRIYPGQSLYKANEQWPAMTREPSRGVVRTAPSSPPPIIPAA